MKKINIINGLGILVAGATLISCSSDFLDTEPKTEISDSEVSTSPTAMRLVVNGMCESMYSQYASLYDFRWFNGEPWLSQVYGDGNGQDYVSLFWQRSLPSVVDWSSMTRYNYTADYIPWLYCYNLISQANMAINADVKENEENIKDELAFRIAQAYTFRAHAYSRLLQIYGPAWDYSNNGTAEAVIIRDEIIGADTNLNKPLASFNQIIDLIYSDLDRALELYDLSEYAREAGAYWEPDKSVAMGVYARAALLKNDWQKAYDMADGATEGYSVMSANEYMGGFATANSETMWATSNASTGIYYASFGATYACNGAYPCIWGSIGSGAIDYTFYRKINNPNDVRCKLFFTPDKVARQMQAQFWNVNNCDEETLDINVGEDLAPLVEEFALDLYDKIGKPNGWIAPFSKNYDTQAEDGIVLTGQTIQFGAQFKFWGTDTYASSTYAFMRVSEMYMIKAEAACHLPGKDKDAQEALYEVNKNRIEGYTMSSNTGQALLDEIKLQRRIELWGEGFSWFDFKRWNEDIVRDLWEEGNTRSGNWPLQLIQGGPTQDGVLKAGYNDGWRWAIPQSESEYNKDVL